MSKFLSALCICCSHSAKALEAQEKHTPEPEPSPKPGKSSLKKFPAKDSDQEEEEEESDEDEADSAVQVVPVRRRRRQPERVRPADLKVQFSENDEICMLWDDDDFRKARVGDWEEKARDSSRFRMRINNCSAVISPILSPEHRLKVQEKLLKMQENHSRDSKVTKDTAGKVLPSSKTDRRPVCVH